MKYIWGKSKILAIVKNYPPSMDILYFHASIADTIYIQYTYLSEDCYVKHLHTILSSRWRFVDLLLEVNEMTLSLRICI